jgi:hypothetical protein
MDRRNKKNSITWNGDASEWFVQAIAITRIEIKKVVKWHNMEKLFGHFGDADVGMTKLVEAENDIWYDIVRL